MITIAVDIGNSTVSFGLFQGKELKTHLKFTTTTKNIRRIQRFIRLLLTKAKLKPDDVDRVIVCSVVPEMTGMMCGCLRSQLGIRPLVVGKDIVVPITNKYKVPKQVGQDRLVAAFAALQLFGPGLIIVDFGTAITFDVVSAKGEYLGGLIFPGLELSLDALYLRTALLPRITLHKPSSLIGHDTNNSINSGIVYGIAGVCDSLIQRLQVKFKKFRVIATGGNAQFFKRYGKNISTIRPHLVLEGINLL